MMKSLGLGAKRLMKDDGGARSGAKAGIKVKEESRETGENTMGWRMARARRNYARSRGKWLKTKGGMMGWCGAGRWVAVGGCRGWNEILICGGARNPCNRPALVHHFPQISRRCERRRNFCRSFVLQRALVIPNFQFVTSWPVQFLLSIILRGNINNKNEKKSTKNRKMLRFYCKIRSKENFVKLVEHSEIFLCGTPNWFCNLILSGIKMHDTQCQFG